MKRRRAVWAFWAAGALAAIGGVSPILFAGFSGRLSGVVIPFWIAAVGFAACGFVYQQGRTVASILYFVAGLAVVFGLLAILSLPLRLAVLGTCPAAPAPCTTGLPRPLTFAENNGLDAAAVLGILAIFVGFFGLAVFYRRPPVPVYTPPQRKIPPIQPVAARAEAPKAEPHKIEPTIAHEPEEEPELPAHEEAESPELPPHESPSTAQ